MTVPVTGREGRVLGTGQSGVSEAPCSGNCHYGHCGLRHTQKRWHQRVRWLGLWPLGTGHCGLVPTVAVPAVRPRLMVVAVFGKRW